VNKLDINSDKEPIYLGAINKDIIKLLDLSVSETGIIIWKDRIRYIEKHKQDFDSEEDWLRHVEAMPEIIQNPDYVGLHPKDNSIQFIKKIDKHILVGVRITNKRNWVVRSSYPISEMQLQTYLDCGTVKSIEEHKKSILTIK
jgi:hypothetical protein